ncbi:MAG: GIY-YIG nuclease family protein [Hyphomicrobiales bacterium]
MKRERSPAVYILATARNGTLYVGVTSDLCSRVLPHREGQIPGFTKRYGVKLLVWLETHGTMDGAIKREKQIKEWRRAWKIKLIEETNPHWLDLIAETCGPEPLC